MFSHIDSFFISHAQWIVRQCELYTPCTKKDLGYTLLAINLLVGLLVLACTTFSVVRLIEDTILVKKDMPVTLVITLLFMAILTAHISTYFVTKKKLKGGAQTDTSTLPKEIITRRFDRLVISISVLLFGLTAGTFSMYILSKEDDLRVIYFMWTVLDGGFVTTWALEYLFCTTSLPPREKKESRAPSRFALGTSS